MIKRLAKKIINFLDKHRFILVILILILVSISFLGINSVIFLNHKFEPLTCTKDIDETYCYNEDIKIFKDSEKIKEKFFLNNETLIKEFVSNHSLPEFNFYTAYYYNEVASLDFIITGENEELYNFLNTYINTYDIRKFYQKNNFYYDIFYYYKIS